MGVLLSTSAVAGRDRFDYWHEVVCKNYAPCLGIVSEKSTFNACAQVHEFGATQVSEVKSTGINYERRSRDLRQDPLDDFFISLMVEGEGLFGQEDRQVRQRKGDVLVYDSARPYSYHFQGDYHSLLLRIPRAHLQSRVTRIDSVSGLLLSPDSPFGGLIGSLLQKSSLIASDVDPSAVSLFSEPTVDMITAAIVSSTGKTLESNSRQQEILGRIKHFMKQHLADEAMTLETIAVEQNVSVRTLSRLFAEAGETPKGWLQTQRLAGAYDALARKRVRNVTEAALSFGFRDLSHFSKSFKKRYGCTPNSLIH